MSIATKTIAGAALAFALGVSGGALAQQAGGPPNGPAMGGPMMGRDGGPDGGRGWAKMDPAEMQKRMTARHAERMQKLHDILAITPNQEGAFKSFSESMTPPKMGDRLPDRDKPLTTTQRLDERMARATEHYNEQKTRIDATRRFYGQLSPTQQKSFDAASDMMRDRMHERGGMMRGERMGFRGGPPMGGPGMMGGQDGPPKN
jgi:periplasmic protein CpxP/Spy